MAIMVGVALGWILDRRVGDGSLFAIDELVHHDLGGVLRRHRTGGRGADPVDRDESLAMVREVADQTDAVGGATEGGG